MNQGHRNINTGTILVSLLFGVLGGALAYKFIDYSLTYTDFIAGSITWGGEGKSKDVSLILTFMIILSLSLVSLGRFQTWIQSKYNDKLAGCFSTTLMYISIPFVIWVGEQFLSKSIPNYELLFFNAWIVLGGLIATFFVLQSKNQLKENNATSQLIVFSFIIFAFATLSPDVLGTVLIRLGEGEGYSRQLLTYTWYIIPSLWLIALYVFKNKIKYYKYSALFFQTTVIGYFVLILPSPYKTEGHLTFFPTQTSLYIITALLIAYSVYDLYKRFKLNKSTDELSFSLLSPFSLAALLILMFLSATSMPIVNPDDYHFGEKLLPFYLISKYHVIPFVDYALAHGFVDSLPALGSNLFLDGTASALNEGGRIVYALIVILSLLVVHRYTGPLVAFLFIMLSIMITWSPWYFIAAVMSLIIMKVKVVKLGVSFFLISLVMFLLAPGQGVVFIIAMLPLVLYRAWSSKTILLNMKDTGISFIVLIIAALFMPWILDMIFAAIRYVLENGPVNFQAYGIAWHHSWDSSKTINSSLAIYEVIRSSWAFVPIIILSFWLLGYYKDTKKKEAFFYALFAVIFVLIMHKYALGRIDPFGLSRPGVISKAVIPLLFISVYLLHFSKQKFVYWVLFFVFWMGLLTPNYLQNPINHAKRTIPNLGVLTKGEDIGIPNLGNGITNAEHISRILAIKKIADQLLDANETFVDVTNRGGLYFYLDRRMPIEAVPYNQPHPSMQQRSVATLSVNPPPMALLKADNINHDGRSVSVRTYRLYRWVMNNYIPIAIDDFIIGVHKDKIERFKHRFQDSFYKEEEGVIQDLTNVNWLHGISRGSAIILVVNNPENIKMYKVNGRIKFINGNIRTVTDIKVSGKYIQVHLSGDQIDNINSKDIKILIGSQIVIPKILEDKMALWDKVFLLKDLQQLPISWGNSQKTLNDRMKNIKDIDFTAKLLNNTKVIESEIYQVTGNDPFVVYDISKQNISGKEAGLLSFDFTCNRKNTKPRMQIFWSADDYSTSEVTSVHFNVHNGHVTVPLDAAPRWLSAKHIQNIRIDLADKNACQTFSIKNLSLGQRILNDK